MDSGMHPHVPPPHAGWWTLPRLAANTATTCLPMRAWVKLWSHVTSWSHLDPIPLWHQDSTRVLPSPTCMTWNPHHTVARSTPARCIRLLRLSISLMEMGTLGCGGSKALFLLSWHLPAPWLPSGARGQGGGLNSPAPSSSRSRESTGSGWGGTGAHGCTGHPGQRQPVCLAPASVKAVLVIMM